MKVLADQPVGELLGDGLADNTGTGIEKPLYRGGMPGGGIVGCIPVRVARAGVGTASDASIAMELGCTAVLMNTGIAAAKDPLGMARAMKLAVEAGRLAYASGRMPRRLYASASSPLDGLAAF